MKKLITWLAALALLAIGGQAYAEEGSHEIAGKQEVLTPEANPADQGVAQRMMDKKNAGYTAYQKQKPPQVEGQVIGGDIKPGGIIQVIINGSPHSVQIPKNWTVIIDGQPVYPPAPVPQVHRTDPGFGSDDNLS